MGITAENQEMADLRIPYLIRTPAVVRFVSAEPLIGRIKFDPDYQLPWINWIIVGGESGPGCRYMRLDWARSIRDQCKDARIA